ncbi:SpaH/EbpB family LPXTG-anchored major pilin [Corynebacterium glutamicum]|uniref:SpaH/EbpB family LPXTG-anchored major pilin n=1 Tax=Corynebacterium glutamicum TaxID=1718 RepID=UPI0007448DA9|nr:SpaH/EbpB family LPXTG-anchored major pilin [Corynebacterium glutamicum]AMA01291.1 hypothetical protein APT58_14205 [Corynebacterium glutamicum]
MKKNHKRISAAVLSLALGFTIAGAPMLAPVASAQQVTITAGQASTVNENAAVTLTIQKRLGEVNNAPNGIADVPFQVQKLNTGSLATLAGWEDVLALQTKLQTTGLVAADFDPSYDEEITTNPSGNIQIVTGGANDAGGDFTVGAYLVTEKAFGNYTVADPFIVTLPHAEGNSWNYEQTVTPKNQLVEVDKTVSDAGVHLGANIAYTISASIPAEDLTSLAIIDDLPDELGAAQSIVVKTFGAIDPLDDIELILNTDYTPDPVDGDGNQLTIELTPAGLTKLNNLRPGNPNLVLQVTFSAKVVELPGNGVISNDVIINYPNQSIDTSSDPNDPNDGSETRFGSLSITKTDQADDSELEGAVFELWRCQPAGTNGWAVIGDKLPIINDPAVVDSATYDNYVNNTHGGTVPTTFSTDVDGEATVYGVQTFDFVNGEYLPSGTDSQICLVEVEAPTGYNLIPEPIPVTDYVDSSHQSPDFYNMTANIENIKNDDLVNLPETGGNGTMAMIAAGVLVAAAGGAAAVRGNRARNK